MLTKLREIINTVTQNYFIEVYYLPAVSAGEIPVGVGHQYVQIKNGVTDFVDDACEATCFDFLLGYQVIKKLKKECKDCQGLEFSLVSESDVAFIEKIIKGT